MKICIIANKEVRGRAKFVAEPLRSNGHIVEQREFSFWRPSSLPGWPMKKECRFDLFIFVGVGAKNLLPFLLARLFRIPAILRLGGHPIDDMMNFLSRPKDIGPFRYLKRLVNFCAAKIILKLTVYAICVNQDLKERILPVLGASAVVFVVPQFCEGETKDYDEILGDPVQCLTVANLNFMSKAKGITWLISQLNAYCLDRGTRINFKIAGDGIGRSIIQSFLLEFELSENFDIEILGFVDGVDSLYSVSDVFIYHSEHDGTPNVILEAKKWGIPTMVNDYPAFRTLIDSGNGLIFSNEQEFHSMLESILTDDDLRKSLSSGARKDYEERFSAAAVAVELETVVVEVCGTNAGR